MNSTKTGIESIGDYIATFPPETRKVLEEVRATIRSAVPEAEETISYGIPTYTLNGKYLVYFAGWKNHVSLYPIPAGSAAFSKAITPYISGKGTLKFPLDKPLPVNLIAQTVKLHVAEYRKKTGTKSYNRK